MVRSTKIGEMFRAILKRAMLRLNLVDSSTRACQGREEVLTAITCYFGMVVSYGFIWGIPEIGVTPKNPLLWDFPF